MATLPPKPDHHPDVGDPVWHHDEHGQITTVLVVRYIAYRGDGRFAIEAADMTHHVCKWNNEDGWMSILSWCRAA